MFPGVSEDPENRASSRVGILREFASVLEKTKKQDSLERK
jgi:hypothetical protein